METTVTEKGNIVEYLLRLADDRLILGHRLSEWCGHAPLLEEDIALANIALDCIGQAKHLYTVASELDTRHRTPDEFVYFRDAHEYKNLLLVEQPNKDFAHTMVRQFLYDAYGNILFETLQRSSLASLSGISQKAIKEIRYHLRHSGQWLVRFGDGTDESHRRAQTAVDTLWRFTDEMFFSDEIERSLCDQGIAFPSMAMKEQWQHTVTEILTKAGLTIPKTPPVQHYGRRTGRHTEYLGHLLAEMQIVARSYPEITW